MTVDWIRTWQDPKHVVTPATPTPWWTTQAGADAARPASGWRPWRHPWSPLRPSRTLLRASSWPRMPSLISSANSRATGLARPTTGVEPGSWVGENDVPW